MRRLLGATLAIAATTSGAAAQDDVALRAAFEGKTVTVRIDMPATSAGVEVYPLDPTPLDFRQLAQRIKDNGLGVRMGQQMMVTKVLVKSDSHIEFQLGGGGYGTFSDGLSGGSDVHIQNAEETKEERALRESIKRTTDKNQRKRLERELDALRSERQRENARAQAEAQQANIAREALLRTKRAESGSRFNIRYRNGIPADALTADGVMRALGQYVEFPWAQPTVATAAPVAMPTAPGALAPGGVSALHKGLSIREVEALLGPAATASEVQEGSMIIARRTYRHDGKRIMANFVSGVLVDYSITPQ